MTTEDDVQRVQKLARQCGLILFGQGPDVQGAVLAELLSIWLAGFQDDDLRAKMLLMHLEHVRPLVDINAAIMRGEK